MYDDYAPVTPYDPTSLQARQALDHGASGETTKPKTWDKHVSAPITEQEVSDHIKGWL